MLANLRISSKIGLIVAIAVLSLAGEMALAWHFESLTARLVAMQSNIEQIKTSILETRKNEKDFLLRSDVSYINLWKKEIIHLSQLLSSLDVAGKNEGVAVTTAALSAAFTDYESAFSSLAAQKTKNGLTPDTGLQGDLRNAVHQAEKSFLTTNDDTQMKNMLMLRRHEKDFLLRHDEDSLSKFEAAFALMMRQKLEPEVTHDLELYHAAFLSLVEGEKAIGLTPEVGLQGTMRRAIHQTEGMMEIMSKTAQDAITAAQARQDSIELLSSLAIGLASALVALLIARDVVTPIKLLTDTTSRLAKGETDVAVGGTERRDEIGRLAQVVEQWRLSLLAAEARRLRDSEEAGAREQRAQELENMTRSFDVSVGSTLDTVSQNSTQLNSTAQALSKNSDQTSHQAKLVHHTALEASNSSQTVAAAAEELTASIQEIARQVVESTRVSQLAADEVQATHAVMSVLSDSSARIGDVVRLIKNIAGKTNLLALNATIEAARAGDQGKGFAVVANEVKALANQTAEATEDISAQVEAVQQSSQQAIEAISGIVHRIEEVRQISSAIAAAVEEQTAATGEIARNIQQTAQNTQDITETIVDVTHAAAETGSASAQVLSSAEALAREAEQLKLVVNSFLSGVRKA